MSMYRNPVGLSLLILCGSAAFPAYAQSLGSAVSPSAAPAARATSVSGMAVVSFSPAFVVTDQPTQVVLRGRGFRGGLALQLERQGQSQGVQDVVASGDSLLTGRVTVPGSMSGSLDATLTGEQGEFAVLPNATNSGDLYWGIAAGDSLLVSGRVGSGLPLWVGEDGLLQQKTRAAESRNMSSESSCDRIPYCTIPINNIFGHWWPSVDEPNKCKDRPESVSETWLTYMVCSGSPCGPGSPTLIKDLDVGIEVHARGWTGWHCHSEPGRPHGSPDSATGNTGTTGTGFSVHHRWPDVSGALNVVFYSNDPGYQFNTLRDTSYIYCINVGTMYELSEGPGYQLKGNRPQHPKNHWGSLSFVDALKSLALDIQSSLPEASPVYYNDMSLPSGGLYDWQVYESPSYAWKRPHCAHRGGNQVDFRIWQYGSDALLERLGARIEANGFQVFKEDSQHWHLTYLGPMSDR